MTASPFRRHGPVQGTAGHPTNYDDTHYADTSEPVADDPTQRRPCARCGMPPTETGADPCIADLPGVVFACCGHGANGYVAFANGRVVRFANQDGKTIRDVVSAGGAGNQPLPPGWAWDQRARGTRR